MDNLNESTKLDLIVYVFMLKHWGKDEHKGIKLDFPEGDRDKLFEKIQVLQSQLKTQKLLSEEANPIATRVDYEVNVNIQEGLLKAVDIKTWMKLLIVLTDAMNVTG